MFEQGSVVKIEPQSWVSKKFPLCNHCDVGEKIMSGQWMVLLHRSGCTECREASPLIVELVKKKGCLLAVLEMNTDNDSLDFGNMKPLTGLMN